MEGSKGTKGHLELAPVDAAPGHATSLHLCLCIFFFVCNFCNFCMMAGFGVSHG